MIKANELRIGNWVYFNGYKKVHEIYETHFRANDKDDISFSSKWTEIKPIPLSPEILEKAGFFIKPNDKNQFYTYNKASYIQLSDSLISCVIHGRSIHNRIQYLHQL